MTDFIDDPTILGSQEAQVYREFLSGEVDGAATDALHTLAAIPRSGTPSYGPLATLTALLDSNPRRWPVLELIRTYVEFWKCLPEDAKAGHASGSAKALLDRAHLLCKQSYSSLIDLFQWSSTTAAIIDPDTSLSAYHNDLAATVHDFRLPLSHTPGRPKPVVAISLPNGPLLAITVLATATHYTAAPVAHGSGVGAEQFKTDVLQSKSNMVLALQADVDRLGLRSSWLNEAGITVLLVQLTADMSLSLTDLDGSAVNVQDFQAPTPNNADDTGIMLFTSGTSGTKKLVPLSIHSMVAGVAMVVQSWGLDANMRCLNQMPLNHVGGLIRNLFAPVLSGGSVICCAAFDANLFWDCVEDHNPTWYYASPSMHQVILEAGSSRPESLAKSRIKLICNAAGGLLPSLAIRLRDTFSTKSIDCTVLPSYGMTECMPISTPPLDYKLEKTGTSGVSVGPEITILNGRDEKEVVGEVGRIAVRGAPVFGGYLKDNDFIDKSCFNKNGWFDTGDMGYLDEEDFLYITGRSKEVINRGGELISPFEVEEAIVSAAAKPGNLISGRISKALAFSVTHDVLQEVVGIAVSTPDGARRADLRGIQEAVKSELSQVKIPTFIVYFEGGLPTNNNKVLRIKLAERLDLPDISDSTPQAERYYEAQCPPPNTALSVKIGSHPMKISYKSVHEVCNQKRPKNADFYIRPDRSGFYPEVVLAPRDVGTEMIDQSACDSSALSPALDGYCIPLKISCLEEPFPRDKLGEIDDQAVTHLLTARRKPVAVSTGDLTETEIVVVRVFAQILSKSEAEISASSDFFDLGGDSMGAGRLLNALRKEYPLRLPINILFTNPKVSQLAKVIDDKTGNSGKKAAPKSTAETGLTTPDLGQDTATASLLPGCDDTCSSTNPFLMLIQLLPLVLFYPMKRALTWTVFMYFLTETQFWPTNNSIPGRLFDLVVSLAVGRLVVKIACPFIGMAAKWILVGRYKQGLYPMWGSYHTRWWLVQKITAICGMGMFGLTNTTRVTYLRLMGAKIGYNVSINRGTKFGEWDLINIGDNVVLERCIVRPFAAERNTSMYLGRVTVERNASIGTASIVAAGTTVPAYSCIGPNSSSWEAADADEANRDLAASKIPGAHPVLALLVGFPIQFILIFIGAIPWLGGLTALVENQAKAVPADQLREVVVWFATPTRVAWHYVALSLNVAMGPFFLFGAVWAVKKIFDLSCGQLSPTRAGSRSQMTRFRMQLMSVLMPAPRFSKLTELFGGHYEATSHFARALGAKVGKRVYWPGTGPSIQHFDLLEVGDDVVFGSRSHLVTSDGYGSNYVRIGSGSMVADRVVLLPGVQLGKKTVMGSGALTKRGTRYADETTWVGSKKNEAICLSKDVLVEQPRVITPNDASDRSPNAFRYSASDPPPGYSTLGRRRSQYQQTIHSPSSPLETRNSVATTLHVEMPDHGLRSGQTSRRSSFNPSSRRTSDAYDNYDREKDDDDTVRLTNGNMMNDSVGASFLSSNEQTVSSSPFGRAFYEGKANYRVWSQAEIFIYSLVVAIFSAVYWNAASISALQVIGHFYRTQDHFTKKFLDNHWYRPVTIYFFFLFLIMGIMTLQAFIAILFTISAKWILMGRRIQGNYDWDKSSYCQRWQLFLKLETFRRNCYGGNGILGMLTGTHWIVLYFRALGAKIGKDCALFAGGMPSLMFTEPDLITLGNRVAVDDASLVGHINTRGKFDLNPLSVGARSVLRSGSRLLSGATMEEDTCLLEHTLVMAGDVVDAGTTSQGWPAEEFTDNRIPSMVQARVWKAC